MKEAVLPFGRFHGWTPCSARKCVPPARSWGIDHDFGTAFAKSQSAAFSSGLPTSGRVFVSMADRDKRSMVFPVKRLADLGFEIAATPGTAAVLARHGVKTTELRKHFEGLGPNGEPTTIDAMEAERSTWW